MSRSKAILTPIKLGNILISARICTTQPLCSQVIQFSQLPSLPSNQPVWSQFLCIQRQFYSSKPNSIADVILSNDWSSELENKLEKINGNWTHETVIYVLKKLDKDPLKALDFFNWISDNDRCKQSSSMCSLVLRVLLRKDLMERFWATLVKMKERGFYLDQEAYTTMLSILKDEKLDTDAVALTHFYNRLLEENNMGSVVKKVVDVILGADWGVKVEKELGECNVVLSDNFVIRVLRELRHYPSKALRFFKWVGGSTGYEHSTVTYNALLRVLGQEDSISDFWNALTEMRSADHELDIDTYIKISRQFQARKMMEEAVKLYELMMDGPYKPSVQDCGILLRKIAGDPKVDLLLRVREKYEATGYSLSKAIYDGIHRSLTSVGNFDEAENIVKAMRNAGYEPDNITYSQLVFGLCKARRLEEACKVLDEMEALGCKPDIKTWTILIKGHCSANALDKALLCFAKMIGKDYEVDADLLDVLINGFISQKKTSGAYKFLDEMVSKLQVKPWQATYKNLIGKLLEVRKLEEAINLLRSMKKHDYPPFPEPFIQYISKSGTVHEAAEFLEALSVKNYPSISSYLHLFQSFLKEGRDSEAKDLLFKSPHHIRNHDKISRLFGHLKGGKATVTV